MNEIQRSVCAMITFTHLGIRYIVKFWKTQNTPTHKSATARFAKKKLVIERNRLDKVTTRITRRFPGRKMKFGGNFKNLLLILLQI